MFELSLCFNNGMMQENVNHHSVYYLAKSPMKVLNSAADLFIGYGLPLPLLLSRVGWGDVDVELWTKERGGARGDLPAAAAAAAAVRSYPYLYIVFRQGRDSRYHCC